MWQLGNIDFVELQVRRIAAEVDAIGIPMKLNPSSSTTLASHYHIAQDTKKPLFLGEWLVKHTNDPALKVQNYLPSIKTCERTDLIS